MLRMDQLFCRFALMRSKFTGRKDNRRDTIQNAARLCKDGYSVETNALPHADAIDGWELLPTAFTHLEMLLVQVLDLPWFLPPTLTQWISDAAKAKERSGGLRLLSFPACCDVADQ